MVKNNHTRGRNEPYAMVRNNQDIIYNIINSINNKKNFKNYPQRQYEGKKLENLYANFDTNNKKD